MNDPERLAAAGIAKFVGAADSSRTVPDPPAPPPKRRTSSGLKAPALRESNRVLTEGGVLPRSRFRPRDLFPELEEV
jgi:hypothetical protein